MSIPKRVGITVAALFVLPCLYLTVRVVEARQATPEMIEAILAENDPQISQIPRERIDMLLKVEDPTFWTNNGWDLNTPGQGLTTLSQGLAKRLYFNPFKPGLRKIELMVIARFALNAKASKEDILSAFLGVAYLGTDEGQSIIGFADGARHWYGKELSDLSTDEFLGLVAMLVGPNALDPRRHADANLERVERIKKLIDNACEPLGLRDVYYEGCKS